MNLFKAVRTGNLDIVEYLVEQEADVNAKDEFGDTPLIDAAEYGHLDIVKYLIEQGADVNAKDNFGDSIIQSLEEKVEGSNYFVEYLKEYGAK